MDPLPSIATTRSNLEVHTSLPKHLFLLHSIRSNLSLKSGAGQLPAPTAGLNTGLVRTRNPLSQACEHFDNAVHGPSSQLLSQAPVLHCWVSWRTSHAKPIIMQSVAVVALALLESVQAF